MKVLAIETSCDETGIALVEGHRLGRGPAESGEQKTQNGFEFTTLKAALLSQAALHAPYGGVYPNLAKREHEKNLPILLEEVLGKSKPHVGKRATGHAAEASEGASGATWGVDAIAVTTGPGLEPALWQGIEFAKKISTEWGVPLIPVNHMEGHLISSLAQHKGDVFELKNVKFPVLALLVSGGHTEFVLMRSWFVYEIIGQTLDDAVGEAFDKVARMLGLPYPGGPEISKLAEKCREETAAKPVERNVRRRDDAGDKKFLAENFCVSRDSVLCKLSLPRPILNTNNCDMSFSGLKTAVLYALRDVQKSKATPSQPSVEDADAAAKESPLTPTEQAAFAREFEDAAADVLVAKTRRALLQTGAETFVLGGGVAANIHIRKQLQKMITGEPARPDDTSRSGGFPDVTFRLPELSITGDNAIMIAQAALAHLLTGHWQLATDNQSDVRAQGKLSISSQK